MTSRSTASAAWSRSRPRWRRASRSPLSTRVKGEPIASVGVGRLKVGDVIVAICVGAAHRKDAFKACEFIIDELKKTTPIWKKEIGPGRERWV